MSIFKGAYEKQTIYACRVQMRKRFFDDDTFLLIITVTGCLLRFGAYIYHLWTLDKPPHL